MIPCALDECSERSRQTRFSSFRWQIAFAIFIRLVFRRFSRKFPRARFQNNPKITTTATRKPSKYNRFERGKLLFLFSKCSKCNLKYFVYVYIYIYTLYYLLYVLTLRALSIPVSFVDLIIFRIKLLFRHCFGVSAVVTCSPR